MSGSARRKAPFLRTAAALLLLGCLLSLHAASFVAVGRQQRQPDAARASQPDRGPGEGSVIVASRDTEGKAETEAPRRGVRLGGARAKPGPAVPKPDKPEESKFPLAAAGGAALAAILFALSQGSSPQADGMPRDAYYVSSSSYVIQSVRDESGQLQTKVDENRGLWTNIPGLKGGQRSSSSEASQRLRDAQQEMRQTQAQIDQAMDEMNQEMAAAFGSPLVGLYPY